MEIVYDDAALGGFITRATDITPDHPVLVDRFLDNAIEIDVDALFDGEGYLYFNMPDLFKAQRMNYGNAAAAQEGLFVRDRRTGYLPYPPATP